MDKKTIMALAIFASASANAKLLLLSPMEVEPFNGPASTSYQSLKVFYDRYSKQIESGAKYLEIATGASQDIQATNAPTSQPAMYKEVLRLSDRAEYVANKVNTTISLAKERKKSIEFMLSDITIGIGPDSCTVTPVSKKIYQGEVHKLRMICTNPHQSTNLMVSYAFNETLRTNGGYLLARINDESRIYKSELANVPNDSRQPLSMKVTVKP